jgi:hypothetical protein
VFVIGFGVTALVTSGLATGAAAAPAPSASRLGTVTTLTEPSPQADSNFGYGVSLSTPGTWLAVGAPNRKVGGKASAGEAYVYDLKAGKWHLSASVPSPAGAGGSFGRTVALSKTGSTLLVGAPEASVGHPVQYAAGSAWVYTRTNSGTYRRQAELLAPDLVQQASFGGAVALSSNGNVALVTSYSSPNYYGAAYIFDRSASGRWTLSATIQDQDYGTDSFFGGDTGAISGAGTTILIGALGAPTNVASTTGVALIYTRSSRGSWTLGKTFESKGTGGFGGSVALSTNGQSAIVGNYYAPHNEAVVYGLAHGKWALTKTLRDRQSGDDFGASVALDSAGHRYVVGAADYRINGTPGAGAAFAYISGSATPTRLAAEPQSEQDAGESVATSGSGALVAVGARAATVKGHAQVGLVHLYS